MAALLPRYFAGLSVALAALTFFCPTNARATAVADVPEVLTLGYQLVFRKALPNSLGGSVTYDINNSGSIAPSFDRVAYYLELQTSAGARQYVYVSFPTVTGMTSATKVGIPFLSTGEFYRQLLTNMNVFSNVSGIVTGTGINTGAIEFWPSNYSAANANGVPNASDSTFDFGDSGANNTMSGYGSMQIHNYDLDGVGAGTAGQVLFALNNFNSGGANMDLGIGNSASANPDYTFVANAPTYTIKNLEVLVHPIPEPAGVALLVAGSLLFGARRSGRRPSVVSA